MAKTMMMMSTSCFSELEVEALPSVVHVGVAEGDVVHGVVADGANHLRGNWVILSIWEALGWMGRTDVLKIYGNKNQTLIVNMMTQ